MIYYNSVGKFSILVIKLPEQLIKVSVHGSVGKNVKELLQQYNTSSIFVKLGNIFSRPLE